MNSVLSSRRKPEITQAIPKFNTCICIEPDDGLYEPKHVAMVGVLILTVCVKTVCYYKLVLFPSINYRI